MSELFDLLQEKNTILGLVVAALFGVIVRYVDKALKQRTDYFEEASKIRSELRDQLDACHKENGEIAKELDDWKKKYWDEVENHSKTKHQNEFDHMTVLGDEDDR